MNVNRTRKWTGLLLSGAVLSSLLVTSSLAADCLLYTSDAADEL